MYPLREPTSDCVYATLHVVVSLSVSCSLLTMHRSPIGFALHNLAPVAIFVAAFDDGCCGIDERKIGLWALFSEGQQFGLQRDARNARIR